MITLENIDLQKITPEELGELLVEAKKAYYVDSKPIMDDHTFDTLEEILHQKAPYHRIFTKVGTKNFDTGFDKKRHFMLMGSQNKVNTFEDLVHYFELKKIPTGTDFVVQPKCDGISLEIEYKKGKFVDAITRGDGEIGDVITQNVVKMKNFVGKLKSDFSGSIRCEIVMTETNFQKLNQLVKKNDLAPLSRRGGDAIAETEEFYSNSRNATSGISQRLDSKFSEFCSLHAVDTYSTQNHFKTEIDKINFLKENGVEVVKTYLCPDFNCIQEIYLKYLNEERKLFPFEIDGLVIKINDIELQHKLGSHNNRPKGQVAYKFPSRTDQTRILSVNWQVGPMGSVTPVAKVEPIEISGAIITFASLANYQLIVEKGINIGDVIEISRRGDVIPHIEKVITKVTPGHITPPDSCPVCNTQLVIYDKFLRCPNNQKCPAQILGSLRVFCATLDIKGISDKTIEKLYTAGKVKLPGDFYKLTVSDFQNLDGLGEKSGTNIVNQIQSKKNLTLKQALDAAVIPNFSSARIQQLINAGFDTPQKILNISIRDLESLRGIQITLAQKIFEGIQSRRQFIESILEQINLKSDKVSNKLSGLTFVITGSLSRPRKDVTEDIENLGGKITAGVTQNTDYLITNESEPSSSKFQAAKKYGTKVINESELEKLLQ